MCQLDGIDLYIRRIAWLGNLDGVALYVPWLAGVTPPMVCMASEVGWSGHTRSTRFIANSQKGLAA